MPSLLIYNTASSGIYVERMLDRIGIGADLKAKTKRYPTGAAVMEHVLKGASKEIGIGPITEIRLYTAKGVTFVGPLPADIQNYTSYDAAPGPAPGNREATLALLTFLAAPSTKAIFASKGANSSAKRRCHGSSSTTDTWSLSIPRATFFPAATWRSTARRSAPSVRPGRRRRPINSMRRSMPAAASCCPASSTCTSTTGTRCSKASPTAILLEDWVGEFLLPLSLNMTEEAMRVSSALAGMEMLATGTTCSLNHSVTTTTPAMVAASIEPQRDLGIRHVYAKELRCRTPGNPRHPLSLDEALAAFEQETRRWDGTADGRVRFAMVIELNAHWVAAGMSTEELICRGYELAKKLGLRISSHIAGGTFSLEMGFLKYLRETGRTDVRYLMQLGILDPNWLLIHCIHVTELDIEHMARVGASFVYTPTSESMRGGGISPVSNAQRAGVTVALGTDGPMVDYSVDMVEQMKVCALMQHVRHLDPTRIGRACARNGDDQCRQGPRARARDRVARSRQARRHRGLRYEQAIRGRHASPAVEFHQRGQRERRAGGAGGRRDRLSRRHVRASGEPWPGAERSRARGPRRARQSGAYSSPHASLADVTHAHALRRDQRALDLAQR